MRDPSGNQITFTFVQIHSNYFPIYMYSTHPFIYLCYDAQRVSLTQGVPLPCLMHFCANGRLFGRGHVVFMPLLLPISNKEEERGSEETESRRSRWPPGTWEAGGEPEETRDFHSRQDRGRHAPCTANSTLCNLEIREPLESTAAVCSKPL